MATQLINQKAVQVETKLTQFKLHILLFVSDYAGYWHGLHSCSQKPSGITDAQSAITSAPGNCHLQEANRHEEPLSTKTEPLGSQ